MAFTPAAMLMGLLAIKRDFSNVSPIVLVAACVVSLACCFGASFMLFARRTALAIVAGVLFLILNGFITLAFGCSSIFR
jgi:hypothetical protein